MQRDCIASIGEVERLQEVLRAKDKTKHWARWQREIVRPSKLFLDFALLPDDLRHVRLPVHSFGLKIPFELKKPYISKDDNDFHVLDNPIRKEHTFRLPMVSATGWKGAFRAALWQLGFQEVAVRLVGNVRDSEEYLAGRLHFFPSFFDEAPRLEVINPHKRDTGTDARGPIPVECVQGGTTSTFFLLYAPLTEAEDRGQIAEDLEVVAKGISAMLNTYGFGAKTSSGYGTAEERLSEKGLLCIRAAIDGVTSRTEMEANKPQAEPGLPRHLLTRTQLQPEFIREDGSLKSEEEYAAFVENAGRKYGHASKQLYNKAKRWWERESKKYVEKSAEVSGPTEEETVSQPRKVSEWPFRTLAELKQLAEDVAAKLREEKQS